MRCGGKGGVNPALLTSCSDERATFARDESKESTRAAAYASQNDDRIGKEEEWDRRASTVPETKVHNVMIGVHTWSGVTVWPRANLIVIKE